MAGDSHERSISRRMFLISGIQAAAGFALIGRLYYLQFVKSEEFTTLSEGNRIKIQLIAPVRGQLLDRTGVPLAENEVNYRLFVERENRKQARECYDQIAKLVELSDERKEKINLALNDRLDRKPFMIKEHLSWDEVAKIEYHLPELAGAYIEEGQLRHYPYTHFAAHLIGYVGRVSESEMKTDKYSQQDQSLFRLPEFKIGKSGAEVLFEHDVRGKAGAKHIEVNVSGISVRELKKQPSEKGEDLKLTIDAELQAYAAQRMGVESGAVVVMDALRGEVFALASMPAFDPNTFSVGISNKYWAELQGNEKNPLLNKAISGLYPPASTFKMLVGLAGLKAETINPFRTFFCPGHFNLGNHRFHCWKPGGHGSVNLENALAESCDTYFYNVANEIGIEPIAEMCYAFGLGKVSELGLLGEKAGNVPSKEWKQRTYNIPWVRGDVINASIGQGYVLASPLQLAIMVARMVNGGHQVQPTLRHFTGEPDDLPLIDIEPAHLELVMSGMNKVMNAGNGTAYWKRIQKEEFAMGGKTGTAQVRRITQRGMNQNLLPWKYRHHGLFVGYAPVHNPRFVCSVVIEHGGGGSSAAAPVASDVLLKVQELAAANPGRYRV